MLQPSLLRASQNKWEDDPLQTNKPVNRKKTVKEYYFYFGSSKQAPNYENTSAYIINHSTLIWKTDPDIWKPSLKASEETDEAIKY